MADDLTHDTFLKLLTLAEPEASCDPRAYLMVTANHVMIDQFRKRKLERMHWRRWRRGWRRNLPNSVWQSVNW
ncbi:MAG: sigma factor [Symbiopectobacterium sp.]